MNKVRSYTIMEMVIVMLLSSIVITIAFKSYDILSKMYLEFNKNQFELSRYATLDRLLTLDFMRSNEIRKTEGGFKMKFPDKEILYTVSSFQLFRKQGAVTDTFVVSAEELVHKFNLEEVSEVGDLIDELSFTNAYKGETQRYHYKKSYGADLLMDEEKRKATKE